MFFISTTNQAAYIMVNFSYLTVDICSQKRYNEKACSYFLTHQSIYTLSIYILDNRFRIASIFIIKETKGLSLKGVIMNENQEPMLASEADPVTETAPAITAHSAGLIQAKAHRKSRISTKLLLFTVALIALAVLSLGIIAVNLGASALTNQANADAQKYTTEGASHVGAIITGNLSTLNEVASRARVTTMDWQTQVDAITGDIERLGYQDIAVMNLDGHAKYIKGGGEFDSWGEFWYEDGFKGELAISDVAISKVTKEPVVFEVAPIESNGQVVGLLVGRRDPTFLKDTTNAMGDGEQQYGFVVNENGAMMAHPDDQMILDQVNVFDDIEKDGTWKSFGLALKEGGNPNNRDANIYR